MWNLISKGRALQRQSSKDWGGPGMPHAALMEAPAADLLMGSHGREVKTIHAIWPPKSVDNLLITTTGSASAILSLKVTCKLKDITNHFSEIFGV